MTPSARLSAAAEVLDQIATSRAPADAVLKRWGQSHRFAGSGDRRAIAARVYACLRARARLAWRMDAEDGRALVLGSLAEVDGLSLTEIEALFNGVAHSPAALSDAERKRVHEPHEPHERAAPPSWVIAGVPEFVAEDMESGFRLRQGFGGQAGGQVGADWIEEAQALVTARAPLDLRVNGARASVAEVKAELEAAGLSPESTPWSSWGLRVLDPTVDVTSLPAFLEGRVEIQDEASQIAAWLAGAAPGMRVVDYCAGGGGKTLALGQALNSPTTVTPGLVPGAHGAVRNQVSRKPAPSTHPVVQADEWAPGTSPGVTKFGEGGGEGQSTSPFPLDGGRVGDGGEGSTGPENSSEAAAPLATSADAAARTPPTPPFLHRGGRESELIACDVNPARLDAIRPRLARAGLQADLRTLGPEGQGVEDLTGAADLVFVDAPCSGSGTWRRRPEDIWRLTPEDLTRLHTLQTEILARAATLVRPGGRLAYATCSILTAENEATTTAFEAAHPAFRPVPIASAASASPNLTDAARRHLASLAGTGHRLRLSPRLTGTDGFFLALYERTS